MPPPPPPPPPQRADGAPIATGAYGYPYSYSHSPSIPILAPGQAPRQQSEAPIPETSRKEVEEPQDEGEVKEFFCDACDLELESAQAFKSHRKSHVKCTECSFEGAPKIVKAHYQGTHGRFSGSGFKTVTVAVPGCRVQRFRICVGNRPEDIERWIAERKRRFPRKETVESPEVPSGMSSLLAGYGSSGSESDNEATLEAPKKVEDKTPSPPSPSALPSIPSSALSIQRTKRLCRYFSRNGSCFNGEACRFSHDASSNQHANQLANGGKKRKRGVPTTSDTLLRKLLSNDMERESALTMQLLEFIVEKDFFGCNG